MDGLLDFIKTPAGQGLLSAAFGGLAGARRGQPLNSIGRAGLAGLLGYSNAMTAQERSQENELQNKLLQQQLAQMESQQRAIEQMIGSLPEDKRLQARAFPQQYAQNVFKEPAKPQLVTVAGPDGSPIQRWVKPGEATGVDVGAAPTKEGALPWFVRRDAGGKTMIDPAYADFEKAKAASGRPTTPYYQFLPTAEGYAVGDARTGRIEQGVLNGKVVMKGTDDPNLQGRLAYSKEFNKTTAEEQAKAQADYPRIVQNANTAIKYADELIKHPGFSQAVGGSSMLGIQKIPGTDAKGFMTRLDQLKGGAFLEAFNTLKGGGQITEVEGKKATDAIARMDNATSEDEFKAAVKDYTDVIRAGMNRAKLRGGNRGTQQPQQDNDPLGIR